MGKDYGKLVKKQIVDKDGKRRTVWVRSGVEQKEDKKIKPSQVLSAMSKKRQELKKQGMKDSEANEKAKNSEYNIDGVKVKISDGKVVSSSPIEGIKEGKTKNPNVVKVDDITKKYSYMKRELEGVKGEVELKTVERKNVGNNQDKYEIHLIQDGKKVGTLGSHPSSTGADAMADSINNVPSRNKHVRKFQEQFGGKK